MDTSVKVRLDRSVIADGKLIGHVFGEPRDWWYMLADGRSDGPWHSKREAAEMSARTWRRTGTMHNRKD